MDLTIIIVSHNVKYFLEQCLISVYKSAGELQVEIYVVDNCSTDGTCDFLQQSFPEVILISNTTNLGYARANNQAVTLAKGKYILFLNPDTIIPEDCFEHCLRYFSLNSRIGALGVKMIEGSGRVLPESKRGFPTPWNSFTKMTGLSSVFPHSAWFSGYYHGNLSLNQNQVIDVLSGAFMMISQEVLRKTGGFDERFFMYAEDIDLSYRIQKSGYENHYLAEISIIHFKGESTRKDKQYVRMFYNAMLQFVAKHYRSPLQQLQSLALRVAIRAKAAVAASRVPSKIHNEKIDHYHFTFSGDPNSIQEAKEILRKAGLSESNSANSNEMVLLCEGPDFSFQQSNSYNEEAAGVKLFNSCLSIYFNLKQC